MGDLAQREIHIASLPGVRQRHFRQLSPGDLSRLFDVPPEPFDGESERATLSMALGATLYVPATRADLTQTIVRRTAQGVCSMVIDLEDAVADHQLGEATASTLATLKELADGDQPYPLLFIRVRNPEGVRAITGGLGSGVRALTGFVFPKFDGTTGGAYLDELAQAAQQLGTHLYAMPVLETAALVHRETRDRNLRSVAALLADHRERVLAVRVGATDMCATFGIRRGRDLTVYDVRVVADVIADIVNYLGRVDGSGFAITGPVWEYFADHERMFRPMLRVAPFDDADAVRFREHLVSRDLDGLLREITLDRANGIQGKTVIHPTHVAAVHALSAVTHEEYQDALDILGTEAGGVAASGYRNKMNEMRPHRNWALHTALRARVFGVTRHGVTFVDLLTAQVTTAQVSK